MIIINCIRKHSFSELNIIKEELKSIANQKRLNYLSLMFIKHELLLSLDYENVIEEFTN